MPSRSASSPPPGCRLRTASSPSTSRGPARCTLRAAIEEVNALAGADVINFAIGTGTQTIVPGSALPTITSVVTINATTQPLWPGTPIIEISGASVAAGTHGLTLSSGSAGSVIRERMPSRRSA